MTTALNKSKIAAMGVVVNILLDECGTEKGDSLVLSSDTLKGVLKSEAQFRADMRRRNSEGNSQEVSAASAGSDASAVSAEQSSGCAIS